MLRIFVSAVLVAISSNVIATTVGSNLLSGYFEQNVGQSSGDVRFIARGEGYAAFFFDTEVVIRFEPHVDSHPFSQVEGEVSARKLSSLRMRFEGAAIVPTLSGEGRINRGILNYFKSIDGKRKRITDVPRFQRLTYSEMYPGIDVEFYFNDGLLEYDVVIRPGYDPGAVAISFPGQSPHISGGTAFIGGAGAMLNLTIPLVYSAGHKDQPISGEFQLADETLKFSVGQYDPELPLVIDPVVEFFGYLGGNATEQALDIFTSNGAIYGLGSTFSSSFSDTGTDLELRDIYVAKVDAESGDLVYAAVIGGTAEERAGHIVVDDNGSAIFTGYSRSNDYPVFNADQPVFSENDPDFLRRDAILTKLTPDGDDFVFSTYIGGTHLNDPSGLTVAVGSFELAREVFIDRDGQIVVIGETHSPEFPVTTLFRNRTCLEDDINGDFSQFTSDVFLARFSPQGEKNLAICLGGSERDAGRGVFQAPDGSLIVTGFTASSNLPTTAGVFQPAKPPGFDYDLFIGRLNSDITDFDQLTYLGGSSTETAQTVVMDANGEFAIAGSTSSLDFPTTSGAFQTLPPGDFGSNGFVSRLSSDLSNLLYSTYIGSGGDDDIWGIQLDQTGRAYLSGFSTSFDLPAPGGLQANHASYYAPSQDLPNEVTSIATLDPIFLPGLGASSLAVLGTASENYYWLYVTPDGAQDILTVPGPGYDTAAVSAWCNPFLDGDCLLAEVNRDGPVVAIFAQSLTEFSRVEKQRSYPNATDVGITSTGYLIIANRNEPNVAYQLLESGLSDELPLDFVSSPTTSVDIGTINGQQNWIVFGNDGSPNVVVPFLAGVGGQPYAISTASNATRDIKLFDLDSDGRNEIITANYNQPNYVFTQLDDGTFGPAVAISPDADPTIGIFAADPDFDGTWDIVAVNEGGSKLYRGNGDGAYSFANGLLDELTPVQIVESDRTYEQFVLQPDGRGFFATFQNRPAARVSYTSLDNYLAVLSPDLSQVEFGTYLGTPEFDYLYYGLSVEEPGVLNIHAAGGDLGFEANALRPTVLGVRDTYMMTLNIDPDGDNLLPGLDNCLEVSNPDQRDTDGDNFGNACDADFDQSGYVNYADLAVLVGTFGTDDPNTDLNGDGLVSFDDLDVFRTLFAKPPGPSGTD